MPIYKTSGTLTGTIERENVAAAQLYLTSDDMTEYLPEALNGLVEHIEWNLDTDGHNWCVIAFTIAQLTKPQLKSMRKWVHGQNADGLGEGFEQQEFAEQNCGDCEGCSGWYGSECDEWQMISFDWETNKCKFVRVK